MTPQEQADAHYAAINTAFDALFDALRAAYDDADAAGASTQSKVGAQTQFSRFMNAGLAACASFCAMGDTVPDVTVQSAPGPKNTNPL